MNRRGCAAAAFFGGLGAKSIFGKKTRRPRFANRQIWYITMVCFCRGPHLYNSQIKKTRLMLLSHPQNRLFTVYILQTLPQHERLTSKRVSWFPSISIVKLVNFFGFFIFLLTKQIKRMRHGHSRGYSLHSAEAYSGSQF